MSTGPEFTQVEQPFIDQLVRQQHSLTGWKFTTGNLAHGGPLS